MGGENFLGDVAIIAVGIGGPDPAWPGAVSGSGVDDVTGLQTDRVAIFFLVIGVGDEGDHDFDGDSSGSSGHGDHKASNPVWTAGSGCFKVVGMESNHRFAVRGTMKEIEEGLDFAPKFDKDGLIPAMAVDATTREPLMLAYMNEESLKLTLKLGEAVYWSRSRKEIWHKGATSGHIQRIVEIRTDCDQDALVLLVEQIGAGACHSGRESCFYRKVVRSGDREPVALDWTGSEKSFDPAAVYGKPQN